MTDFSHNYSAISLQTPSLGPHGHPFTPQSTAPAANWIMEEMEPMSEDEQVGGVQLPADPSSNPMVSFAAATSSSSWTFQAPIPFPPNYSVGVVAEAMTAAGSEYPYSLDGNGLPPFASTSLELVLDDDQPSVSDYNRVQDVCEFIDRWAMCPTAPGTTPTLAEASRTKSWDRPVLIKTNDLQGDRYDVQGIDWTRLGTSRAQARRARALFYQKHASKSHSLGQWSKRLPSRESYFKFRRMNAQVRPYISHFQLRNLITAISQTDIYYAGRFQVVHTDGQRVNNVIDLSPSSATWQQSRPLQITCLASSEDLLVVGGFSGEYALTRLSSETTSKVTHGFLTHELNGITNHVHTFSHRHGYQTQAAFCSNDRTLRVLDCHTNSIIDRFRFPFAINCSSTSPDGRLRMIVGDSAGSILTNAETGQTLEQMFVHGDDVFACAWADDGIHVATAAQDSKVVVYDARRWDLPLSITSTELSCARSLRFSPVGGGKRLLFVAEASDFVNVVDAQSFETCQKLDFFGTIGGIALSPDGSSLHVANCDPKFGGLLQYDQIPAYGRSSADSLADNVWQRWRRINGAKEEPLDWFEEKDLKSNLSFGLTPEYRFRRGLRLDELTL